MKQLSTYINENKIYRSLKDIKEKYNIKLAIPSEMTVGTKVVIDYTISFRIGEITKVTPTFFIIDDENKFYKSSLISRKSSMIYISHIIESIN